MLTEKITSTLKDAAQKLTGSTKRAFMAKVTQDYFDGSARKTESHMGWSRQTVHKGLKELETGFICIDNYVARGRKKIEEHSPHLKADMHDLVQEKSQVDPTFRSTLSYARISARAVREALLREKGYHEKDLPSRQTIGNILNRLGYRLKKTQKTKPIKKIPETDAIFAHVHQANKDADQHAKSLRISIDSKAKVKIGHLSRGGKDRTKAPRKAEDHDTDIHATLVPFGILDVLGNQLTIFFGQSYETSDFIVDCLEHWWDEHAHWYPEIEA
jgi:Rhodopirellula transposase DDE domain